MNTVPLSVSEAVEGKWAAALYGVGAVLANWRNEVPYGSREDFLNLHPVYTSLSERAILENVLKAETIVWHPSLLDALIAAAVAMPHDACMRCVDFPVERGWLWFGTGRDSIAFGDLPHPDKVSPNFTPGLVSIEWNVTSSRVRVVFWFEREHSSLMTMRPLFSMDLEDGEPISAASGYDAKRFGLLLAAAVAWMRQEIVVPEPGYVERHARRRLDREASSDFNRAVRVILLRRRAHDVTTTENAKRNWTCQWIVSGHWRNQYHPSDGRHEQKYIIAYPKGPRDKPLKPPSERVFAVIR